MATGFGAGMGIETARNLISKVSDEKNDEIKIDQARAKYLKNRESDSQKVRSETVKKSNEDDNHYQQQCKYFF